MSDIKLSTNSSSIPTLVHSDQLTSGTVSTFDNALLHADSNTSRRLAGDQLANEAVQLEQRTEQVAADIEEDIDLIEEYQEATSNEIEQLEADVSSLNETIVEARNLENVGILEEDTVVEALESQVGDAQRNIQALREEQAELDQGATILEGTLTQLESAPSDIDTLVAATSTQSEVKIKASEAVSDIAELNEDTAFESIETAEIIEDSALAQNADSAAFAQDLRSNAFRLLVRATTLKIQSEMYRAEAQLVFLRSKLLMESISYQIDELRETQATIREEKLEKAEEDLKALLLEREEERLFLIRAIEKETEAREINAINKETALRVVDILKQSLIDKTNIIREKVALIKELAIPVDKRDQPIQIPNSEDYFIDKKYMFTLPQNDKDYK